MIAPSVGFLPEHISPSSARNYLGCPHRFQLERVLRIPAPVSPALHVGRAVHAALQMFHRARWRGGDDSPSAVRDAYECAFLALELQEGPVSFKDDAHRDKVRDDGARVVAAYLESGEAPTEPPRGVEVSLKETLPGLAVPLTGTLDLVLGDRTTVDFKSAASRPDPEQALFDHEIQLVSYQMLVESATGETPPTLDLLYLVKTKTPQVIRLTSPPADDTRKRRVLGLLALAVEGIASGRFHPQPGPACAWCPFRTRCLAWQPDPQSDSPQQPGRPSTRPSVRRAPAVRPVSTPTLIPQP